MQTLITPKVSIIVASHREYYIYALATNLLKSLQNPIPSEIVIVADYDIKKYQLQYTSILWFYVPNKSIPMKRNKGIREASGEICAFIDDDCIPGKNWLVNALDFLDQHPHLAGVEGLTEVLGDHSDKASFKEYKRLEKPGFRTNNIFYRRDVLLKIHMFDERFSVQREDVDLAYTILESGLSIGYSQAIKVGHRFREHEKWDLLKNCINRRFDPLLFLKHPKSYRNYLKSPYPPSMSLILLIHIITIITLVFLRQNNVLYICIDLLSVLMFTLRRAGLPRFPGVVQWIREYISDLISPLVVFGALIYGSVRFKKLFLF